jgi:hypothetical protein
VSNLAKTLKEIRQRSAHAPRGRLVNPDQLESLRASPDDVRTLLGILDIVFLGIYESNTIDSSELLFAMERAVAPDLILTEQ